VSDFLRGKTDFALAAVSLAAFDVPAVARLTAVTDAGNVIAVFAELLDGTPRALDSNDMSEDAERLTTALEAHFGDVEVRLRETGRYIAAEVDCASPKVIPTAEDLLGKELAWRLASLTFRPI